MKKVFKDGTCALNRTQLTIPFFKKNAASTAANCSGNRILLFMKSKLCLLAVAALLASNFANAQTNPPPRTGSTTITLDKMAAASSNPLGVDTNVVSLLSFDSELPLKTAIETLATQANLKFRYTPELSAEGKENAVLSAPVGEARFEQTTAFEALQRLLRKNNLVLGRLGGTPDVLIGTRESNLTPVTPVGAQDLDRGPTEGDFEVFADSTAEIPLQTAILMLARFAKIPVVLDPKLKSGGERVIGTNLVNLPSITNVTVNLASMGDLSAKQRLTAILNVHDLQMIHEPTSGTHTVTFKDPGAREPLLPNVVPLRYSNTTNVQDLIRSSFPQATIRADTRTASLLVLSTAKDFEQITNLVAQLDTPTKQVLIEARFLETIQNPKSTKGIDWSGTLQANTVTFGNGNTGVEQTRGSITTTTGSQTPNGRPGPTTTTTDSGTERAETTVLNPNAPGFTLNTARGFSPSTAFLNAQGVSAVLSLLNTDADTRTLATPRAVTLDNQETRLEVTRAIPIFDASEGIGQAGTTVSSTKPNYTNVGTILIVTPRISGTNVQMKLRPEISDTAGISDKQIAGRRTQADIFTMQKMDTQVIIPSGHTLVMGGLMQDSSEKNFTKVPILGDIPVLGWAFRSENQNRRKRAIIIFVTPTIIDDLDFQPYRTEFLNTKMPEHPPIVEDPMLSGKPSKESQVFRTKSQPEIGSSNAE